MKCASSIGGSSALALVLLLLPQGGFSSPPKGVYTEPTYTLQFDEWDTDGSGYIEKEEWLDNMSSVWSYTEGIQMLDRDNNGYLDYEETRLMVGGSQGVWAVMYDQEGVDVDEFPPANATFEVIWSTAEEKGLSVPALIDDVSGWNLASGGRGEVSPCAFAQWMDAAESVPEVEQAVMDLRTDIGLPEDGLSEPLSEWEEDDMFDRLQIKADEAYGIITPDGRRALELGGSSRALQLFGRCRNDRCRRRRRRARKRRAAIRGFFQCNAITSVVTSCVGAVAAAVGGAAGCVASAGLACGAAVVGTAAAGGTCGAAVGACANE